MPLRGIFFIILNTFHQKKYPSYRLIVLFIFAEISCIRLFILLNCLLVIRSYFYSMVVPFFNGVFFGLMLIFVFGPTFFALIQTSIQQGVKRSLLFVLGAFFIDFLFVSVSLYGLSDLLNNPDTVEVRNGIAMIAMLGAGLYYWFKTPYHPDKKTIISPLNASFKYLFKGMIINLLNPFLLVFWISLISVVEANYNYDDKGNRYFFLGVLTISLILDISKSLLAQKLKDLIQPKVIASVNKILSIVMLLFSLRIGYALITS